MPEHLDSASRSVILITFILLLVALFHKGFTHGLFLEAGVFLVSVKLILVACGKSLMNGETANKPGEIRAMLEIYANQ